MYATARRRQTPVAQIEAAAREVQKQVGPGFSVNPNRAWVHIRCTTCGESNARDTAVQWALEHKH